MNLLIFTLLFITERLASVMFIPEMSINKNTEGHNTLHDGNSEKGKMDEKFAIVRSISTILFF